MEKTVKLSDVKAGDIGEMKINQLRELCRIEEMKVGGSKKELIDRLLIKKTGRSDRYTSQFPKCRVCGAKVIVKGTDRKPLDDGRTLVTRNIRCIGKHRHTYPIKELLSTEEPAAKK